MTFEEWKVKLNEKVDECEAAFIGLGEIAGMADDIEGEYDEDEFLAHIQVKAMKLNKIINKAFE